MDIPDARVGACVSVYVCVFVCACGGVRSRFGYDKTPVFSGIISLSPDSSMLCIYGGNNLTSSRQTDTQTDRQLSKAVIGKNGAPISLVG